MGICQIIVLLTAVVGSVSSHSTHNIFCSSDSQCDQTYGLYCMFQSMSPGCSVGTCKCHGETDEIRHWNTDANPNTCRLTKVSQGGACATTSDCNEVTGLTCNGTLGTCECSDLTNGWVNGLCSGDSDKHRPGETCGAAGELCVFLGGLTSPVRCIDNTTKCECPNEVMNPYTPSGESCVSRIVKKGQSCTGQTDSFGFATGTGGLCDYNSLKMNCSASVCSCLAPNTDYFEISTTAICRTPGTVKNGEYCTSGDCAEGNVCVDCNQNGRKICRTAGSKSSHAVEPILVGLLVLLGYSFRAVM